MEAQISLEVVSKPQIRPNCCVVPPKLKCSLTNVYAPLSIRGTPYLDAHLNLLKSRRAIPRSSGKPYLGF
jgi:hypothetical protein